jgi:hypothetical protein
MAMTLQVYRVDREGNRTEIRPMHEVVPLKAPEILQSYPPCRCYRCREQRKSA